MNLRTTPADADDARRRAEQFVDHERQFHLGVLPTEQSHPRTVGLAETAAADPLAAIAMLQAVDADCTATLAAVLCGEAFQQLVAALAGAIAAGKRICFSGCGATGRLSILLETCWRGWCDAHPAHRPLAERATSIMTGGDYALIRSVENFEDYQQFGRRQVRELGLGTGDVLVAISEGGETSSVIGTVWQAVDDGATVFFLFNNPAAVLAQHIERSRQVIADRRVTKLDLCTGPMAVAGSTRMQATTTELLVVGAALEAALRRAVLGEAAMPPAVYAERFAALVAALAQPAARQAIAAAVVAEEAVYRQSGLVTYWADEALLDIFTDTTERSPTFMLPRFRPYDDEQSPPPWACVKDPLRCNATAWLKVLRRRPRCLQWSADDYAAMDAPARLRAQPPTLDRAAMQRFCIGNDPDPSRWRTLPNLAVLVAIGDEVPRLVQASDPLRRAFLDAARPFAAAAVLAIGPGQPAATLTPAFWHVPVDLPPSELGLWDRLAAKLVLNALSTATMARMGRLQSNWMVHVEPTNKKLIDRGTRLIAELAGVDYRTACIALHASIDELARTTPPGVQRPSPVAAAIARLRRP